MSRSFWPGGFARRVLSRLRAWLGSESARPLAAHLALGRRGEDLAAEYLEALGFRLVAANFHIAVGRDRRGAVVQAEIDLVAYEGPTLCFVEVKTRASDWFAAPEANVDRRKQRQITRAARAYRRMFGLGAAPYRYDVVSVILPPPDDEGRAAPHRIELLRGFWTEEQLRPRRPRDSPERAAGLAPPGQRGRGGGPEG